VELENVARSATPHAEDTIDLLDASIVGISTRLEADGANQQSLAKIKKITRAREAGAGRVNKIIICRVA
jgi:hypothetical protein